MRNQKFETRTLGEASRRVKMCQEQDGHQEFQEKSNFHQSYENGDEFYFLNSKIRKFWAYENLQLS